MVNFKRKGFRGQWQAQFLALLLVSTTASPTCAHETDNFNLPLDVALADLGDYVEAVHTLALEVTVLELNTRIERAARTRNARTRERRLQTLHDPHTLAKTFRRQFGHPMVEDSDLERALKGKWARRAFPGLVTSHQDISMHFSAYALWDPRRWTMLTQSRTIKAYGVYFGTDKLLHLHRLGFDYYSMYLSLIKGGVSPETAYDQVLEKYCRTGILSEEAMFGTFSTGIYSNADLAVNHIGFKFFCNLTEPIRFRGQHLPPLVVRTGVFWRLNSHVHLRSGWFAPFVTDHWNEALNPSRYQPSFRKGTRRALEKRAPTIIQFYTTVDGRPATAEYFDALARELSTFDGEYYGHSGDFAELMTIGNTCFPALPGGRLPE